MHSTQEVLDQPDDPENPAEPALDVSGFDEQNQIDDERAAEAEPDPWAYDGPEGTASTVPDPFAAPA